MGKRYTLSDGSYNVQSQWDCHKFNAKNRVSPWKRPRKKRTRDYSSLCPCTQKRQKGSGSRPFFLETTAAPALQADKISWKTNDPVWVDQWSMPPEKVQAALQLVQEQLRLSHLEPSTFPWNTHIFVIKKKNGTWRLLQELRPVNKTMVPMGALQPGTAMSLWQEDHLNSVVWGHPWKCRKSQSQSEACGKLTLFCKKQVLFSRLHGLSYFEPVRNAGRNRA